MPPDNQTLDVRLDLLHSDVGEIKSALGKLSEAIIKLALIEERQAQSSASLERAFKALERVESRLSTLEQTSVNSRRVNGWIDKMVTAAVGLILLLLLRKAGII